LESTLIGTRQGNDSLKSASISKQDHDRYLVQYDGQKPIVMKISEYAHFHGNRDYLPNDLKILIPDTQNVSDMVAIILIIQEQPDLRIIDSMQFH